MNALLLSHPARALLVLLMALLLQACATPGPLQNARDHYRLGDTDKALADLDPASLSRRDRLLGWLDRGLIAHMAGEYEISRDAFFEADALIEELDKISVSEQTSAVLISDWATSYRGEYSEQLWVHTFQMMNFLLLGESDGAAVEARQALEVLDAHGTSLTSDRFSRSLIGLSFLQAGQFDSAAIELSKLYEDYPDDADVAALAARAARQAGRIDDAKRFAGPDANPRLPKDHGELLVFLSQGRIARKRSGDLFLSATTRLSFPFYPPDDFTSLQVTARVDGKPVPLVEVRTVTTDVSRRALEARGKSVAARQLLRATGKHAIGEAAYKENEVLGVLVKTLLVLLEQADTRSWETLPATLSLVRIDLPEGRHDVHLTINDGLSLHDVRLNDVEINHRRPAYRRFDTRIRRDAGPESLLTAVELVAPTRVSAPVAPPATTPATTTVTAPETTPVKTPLTPSAAE